MSELFSVFMERYSTDKNFLISAPTGSGKTYLAKYLLANSPGLAVYVSPLKALSREVYEDLKDKIRVKYSDSDVYEDDLRSLNSDVLLATYEKFDSAIRHNYRWLTKVKMIIIDEIHSVEEDRGLAIENIVLWAKNNSSQIVALSGTLPNIDEYSRWLNAQIIDYKKRKVPLHLCIAYPYVIKCYDNSNKIPLNPINGIRSDKLQILTATLNYVTALGKNAIVFVKSRKSTEWLADTLKKFGYKASHYHSGIPLEERKKIVELLKSGNLNVIVSTTALGQGVNLPVFASIFYDLSLPESDENGNFKGWKDITPIEFLQMAGRAGRPGYDSEGMAIIISTSMRQAEEFSQRYFTQELKGSEKKYTLDELILGIISWNENKRSKEIYSIVKGSLKFSAVKEEDVDSSITSLYSVSLVEKENEKVRLTKLGRAVSMSYIGIDVMKGFQSGLVNDPLSVVSSSNIVLQSLRGCKSGKELIRKWSEGENISGLCENLSDKDINEVLSNAKWISFALYRVLRALGKDESKDALKLHYQIEFGVPFDGIKLAKLGLDRNLVMKFLQRGINSDIQLCILAGSPPIKSLLINLGYSPDGVCKEIYSNDLTVYEMKRVVEKFYNKRFKLSEVKHFGIDAIRRLYRMGYIVKDGDELFIPPFSS
ncbi:DEAD/DEAH box helicase [Candidatus Acidianus copahuensis]|nr:DEAD/DEAH box helicase [Candidatus Acidianus copahuensis]